MQSSVALNKWNKHIQHHSALPLFRDIQCFDPRFIRVQTNRQDILSYTNIIEFQNPVNVLLISAWYVQGTKQVTINNIQAVRPIHLLYFIFKNVKTYKGFKLYRSVL